jgi:hypothetical protein
VLAGAVAAVALVVWLGDWWGRAPSAPEPEPAALADRAATAARTSESVAPTPSAAVPTPTPTLTSPPAPEVVAVPEDWAARLTELYQRRAEALSTGSAALLEDVYAPGSPLLTADQDSVGTLAAAGEALRGFAPEVLDAAVLEGTPGEGRVILRVVDHWPGYEVVPAADPGGPALRPVGERGEAEVRMTLVATPEGWRIASAERVG